MDLSAPFFSAKRLPLFFSLYSSLRSLILLLSCCFLALPSEGQKEVHLSPIKVNQAWGVVNQEGILQIPTVYEQVQIVQEALILVKKEGKFGALRSDQTIVLPLVYDKLMAAGQGLLLAKKEGKYGYLKEDGQELLPFVYEGGYPVEENGWIAVKQQGKWGFIDQKGAVKIPLEYDYVRSFEGPLLPVAKKGKIGLLNVQQKIVMPIFCDQVGQYGEGLIAVGRNGLSGYLEESGQLKIQMIYHQARAFKEGLAAVKMQDTWGYINTEGAIVLPFEYEEAASFEQGLAKVKKAGKWQLIDPKGTSKGALYDNMGALVEGNTWVQQGPKIGYINETGQLIIAVQYDGNQVRDYSEGVVAVRKDNTWGYLDVEGNAVLDFVYQEAGDFKQGLALVVQGDKRGYINQKGEWIYLLPSLTPQPKE